MSEQQKKKDIEYIKELNKKDKIIDQFSEALQDYGIDYKEYKQLKEQGIEPMKI